MLNIGVIGEQARLGQRKPTNSINVSNHISPRNEDAKPSLLPMINNSNGQNLKLYKKARPSRYGSNVRKYKMYRG